MLLDCSRLLQNNMITFISNTTFAKFPDMEYLYVLYVRSNANIQTSMNFEQKLYSSLTS